MSIKKIVDIYFKVVYFLCDIVHSLSGGLVTANLISIGRVFQGYYALYLAYHEHYFASLMHLISSLYLDHIDGVWARRYNQVTKAGAYIDRTGDKIMVIGYLLWLITLPLDNFLGGSIFVMLVFELLSLVTSMKHAYIELFFAYRIFNVDNKASGIGKAKMIVQYIVLILFSLYEFKIPELASDPISALVIIATLLSCASLVQHHIKMQNATL